MLLIQRRQLWLCFPVPLLLHRLLAAGNLLLQLAYGSGKAGQGARAGMAQLRQPLLLALQKAEGGRVELFGALRLQGFDSF